jgi:hypothetical protein
LRDPIDVIIERLVRYHRRPRSEGQ